MLLTKQFRVASTKALDEPGTVECIASVTNNKDLQGDVIPSGAFGAFLGLIAKGEADQPSLVWGHRADDLAHLTGRVLEMRELMPGDGGLPTRLKDAGLGGLYVKAQYNLKTQAGRDAYEHVLAGDIHQWSFMFECPDVAYEKGVRILKEIGPIYEVSNVLVGANPATSTLGVKSMDRVELAKEIVEKAKWSTAMQNDLPDSSFAYIEDGGEKDDDGKTKPRSLRHLPYKDADGKVDLPHVRNALARLDQTQGIPDAEKSKIRSRLEDLLPKDDGKAAALDDAEVKDLPVLTGEEEPHNVPLRSAMTDLATLIEQEIAEKGDDGEPTINWQSVADLAYQAIALERWAEGQENEDDQGQPETQPTPQYFAAEPAETKSDEIPAWMLAALVA